jgi:hypothetical protein
MLEARLYISSIPETPKKLANITSNGEVKSVDVRIIPVTRDNGQSITQSIHQIKIQKVTQI